MFPSRLNLIEFVPGQRLELQRQGFNWRWFPRIGCSLFLLPFLLIPLGILAGYLYSGTFPETTGKTIAFLVFIPVFFGFWYGMIAIFMKFSEAIFGDWSRLGVEGTDGELLLEYAGKWFWLSEEYRVTLNRIQEITLEVRSKKGQTIHLFLEIEYRTRDGQRKSVSPYFRIEELDLDKEALAFLFAIANFARIDHYRVVRSDHLETEIKLSRNNDGDDWQEVPTVDGKLDFDADLDSTKTDEEVFEEVEEPEIELGTFDPDEYKNTLANIVETNIEWDPDHRIRIHMPSIGLLKLILISLFTGAIFGIVLTVFMGETVVHFLESNMNLSFPVYYVGVGITVLAAVFWFFYYKNRYRKREAVFDINNERLKLREGTRHFEGSFSEIRQFVLQGVRDHNDDSADDYSSEVIVECGGDRWTLLISGESHKRDDVYRISGSLVQNLAELTNSSWKWKGFDRRQTTFG